MVHLLLLLSLHLLCLGVHSQRAPSGLWDAFNYAPSTKTVYAKSIHGTSGSVSGASNLLGTTQTATLSGNISYVTLDFGIEVGGLVSLNFASSTSGTSLKLSFTESPAYIRPLASDESSHQDPSTTYDGVLSVPSPLPKGYWTIPDYSLRAGFRYLTLVNWGTGSISFSNVSCAINFMPHVSDLRAYSGYFYAKDPVMSDSDFLTKLWYAGAYTVQTNTVPVDTGRFRHVTVLGSGNWLNNGTLGIAGPIVVDGAKRDRQVLLFTALQLLLTFILEQCGDLGVSVPTQFVSTNDMLPTSNALATFFSLQDPQTGELPESGPPTVRWGSDTYHAWTLIGTYNYYMYTGDDAFLKGIWSNYTKAVTFLGNKVQSVTLSTGESVKLLSSNSGDWGRIGTGGFNAAANALYYRALIVSSSLASYLGQSTSTTWATQAASLKTAYNKAFWLPSAGMYKDNTTATTLCAQDANSMAVLFNLTDSQTKASSISTGLKKNWGKYGAAAPELPGNISPFIGGFEIQAHWLAGDSQAAMDLIRTEWGYMLTTNLSVQSTLLEGYTTNGSLWYRAEYGLSWDPAFTSHAHGWSSGPTLALTHYVLGLNVASPNGKSWLLAPYPSGLPSAQGGFSTGLGWFGVKWTASQTGKGGVLEVSTPVSSSGSFRVPKEWGGSVLIDGVVVGTAAVGSGASFSVAGGNHTISVA